MIRTKKIILFAFFTALLIHTNYNASFAAYDIIKANTINDYQNNNETETAISSPTYDDTDFDSNEAQGDLAEKFGNFFKKKKRNKLKSDESKQIKEENNSELTQAETKFDKNTVQNDSIEIDEKNKFLINANKVSYNDNEGNIYAKGNVEIIAKAQNVSLKADEAILDKSAQTLKLNGNVRVIKNNIEMQGQSLIVDLNEQNILMDNPTLDAFSFIITAQEGYLIENDIQMLNGILKSDQKKEFSLRSNGFMHLDNMTRNPFFDKIEFPQNDSDQENKQSYKIDVKEIQIVSHKDHNSLLLKGSNIYYNNHKIVKNSDIEILSDKSRQIVEVNAPEAGNLRNFGTYLGYGMLFKMPKGHTLKLMPVAVYKDGNIGAGAIARYRSKNGVIDGGWNTASENVVVRGRYQITPNFSLTYGRHAYMPEGFMGARRSGYAAQFQYSKSYAIKDLKASFSNGIYAGIFSDYDKDDQENAFATTRFRYMAQLSKDLYRYKNKEQDFTMILSGVTQGAATLYGTGDTHGIIRIGPQLTTRLKRWEQSIGYLMTGEHGGSPFYFDAYRYGKSTITLNEKFHFNDKLALGFRLFVTPLKDNIEEDLFTECRFYIVTGPKDLKVALSYDFVRDVAHLNFMFLVGSDNSKITFEKFSTKDIDGKVEKRDFYKHAKRVKIEKPENI